MRRILGIGMLMVLFFFFAVPTARGQDQWGTKCNLIEGGSIDFPATGLALVPSYAQSATDTRSQLLTFDPHNASLCPSTPCPGQNCCYTFNTVFLAPQCRTTNNRGWIAFGPDGAAGDIILSLSTACIGIPAGISVRVFGLDGAVIDKTGPWVFSTQGFRDTYLLPCKPAMRIGNELS